MFLLPNFLNKDQIARQCFGKSAAWLSQKMNNITVHRTPEYLKQEHKKQLALFLKEKGEELIIFSESLLDKELP